jgi:hypothetical protein
MEKHMPKVGDHYVSYHGNEPTISTVRSVYEKNGKMWVNFDDDVISVKKLNDPKWHYILLPELRNI